jgi:hypothetical protein
MWRINLPFQWILMPEEGTEPSGFITFNSTSVHKSQNTATRMTLQLTLKALMSSTDHLAF